MSTLADEILAVIASLDVGEVVSYGDVAHDAGHPGAARAVGALLATSPQPAGAVELPWWRVVRGNGRLVTANPRRQAALLRAEGVTVRNDRVVDAPTGRFAAAPARAGSAVGDDAAPDATAALVVRVGRRRRVGCADGLARRALELDEHDPDVGQGRPQRRRLGAEPVAEAVDERPHRVRMANEAEARSGGSPERWIVASSYRPIT